MTSQAPTPVEQALAHLRGQLGVPRHSEWMRIDQTLIDRFADVTGDHAFIHVDPERAGRTALGGTIAHGLLTLSLLPTLMGAAGRVEVPGAEFTLNYGFDRIRFVHPVREGARVRLRSELVAVEKRGEDQIRSMFDLTVEIKGAERPALVARWLMQSRVPAEPGRPDAATAGSHPGGGIAAE